MEPLNTLTTFAANAAKITIDIPFYIYTFFRVLIVSIGKRLRRRRKNLNGEIMLVTGAASGMGQSVVVKLAEKFPLTVFVLWDINEVGLAETKRKCGELGADKVYTYRVDLSNRIEVVNNAALVRQQVGQVSILFNNAGLANFDTILEANPEKEELVIRVNLFSYMWTIKEFLPGMIQKGSGHLVSTCSGLGFHRFSHLGSYCASKFGLQGYLECLKLEMSQHPDKPDIKFSTIYPGFVKTPMVDGVTWEPRYKIDGLEHLVVDQAADGIVEGILKEKEEIFVQSIIRLLQWGQGWVPAEFRNAMEKHLMRNLKYNGKLLWPKANKLECRAITEPEKPLEITTSSLQSTFVENEAASFNKLNKGSPA